MLVSMIKLQTGKAEVNKYVEDESQKLREYVAEACEELDEVGEANKARAELEFGAAMAQLDAEANEVENLINSTRKQAKEDQAAQAAFEERLANERNSGLMFQSLYSSKQTKKPLTSAQQESIQEEVDKLNAVTNNQLGKNSRMISFGLLGLGLISLGVAALTQGSEFSKYEFVFFLFVFLLLGLQVGYEQQRFTEWKAKESDGDGK
ncbi:hypothetical protein CYMTET_12347 [Cymbomonas tetramitiformis]|uniref:Uncharacterized protein n=1 Tax=Cymbomonas tetramitiformis TaxID=36881 RepID=A0AAE0GLV7_9CHLO|nr:hypothetical protein CYMTET_12347 [Cymbomonas tetramitiformis]